MEHDQPTQCTRSDFDNVVEKLMNQEISKHVCRKCLKEYILDSYGHHIGFCDECWFARFPKDEVEAFYLKNLKSLLKNGLRERENESEKNFLMCKRPEFYIDGVEVSLESIKGKRFEEVEILEDVEQVDREGSFVDQEMLATFRACLENLKYTNPGCRDWDLYWGALMLCKNYFESQHKTNEVLKKDEKH